MKKSVESLPHEIAPGVFRASDLELIPRSQLYSCESHEDGTAATIIGVGELVLSRYMGLNVALVGPTNKKQARVLAATHHSIRSEYQRLTDEASRVKHLAVSDGRIYGYVKALSDTGRRFGIAADKWKDFITKPTERRDYAEIFLTGQLDTIIGGNGFFDGFDYEGQAAVEALSRQMQSLKSRAVTQRRLSVHDSGTYIASRRGSIWMAVSESELFDMSSFKLAAPLAGFALTDIKKQHTANYKKRIVTPVVIGRDAVPYRARHVIPMPFTLLQDRSTKSIG